MNGFVLLQQKTSDVIPLYVQDSEIVARELFTTMPAGVSWPQYLKMLSASLLSMLAGAELVHRYYRPDLSVPEIPPKPGELKTQLLGITQSKETKQESS
ncbi:ubiquinol-cytochrome c reductase complex assembly factor 6 [Lithobates pipiens]